MKKIIISILFLSLISCATTLKTPYGDVDIHITAETILEIAQAIEGRGPDKDIEKYGLTDKQISWASSMIRNGNPSMCINEYGNRVFIGE